MLEFLQIPHKGLFNEQRRRLMNQKSSKNRHKNKNRQNIIQLGKMDFHGKINLTLMSTPTVTIDVFTSFFAVQCKYKDRRGSIPVSTVLPNRSEFS